VSFLSQLKLRHFRNYGNLEAPIGLGLTVVVGENGQGKSNLLEAVHYLSLLRSFRTRRTSDLHQWDAPYFHLDATLSGSASALDDHRLTITHVERRRLRIDGQPVPRASEFINRFLCTAFVPEDIELVKGGPSGRRRFLDILLSQTRGEYLARLVSYTTALRSRNAMLRDPTRFGRSAITAYDGPLAEHGAYLVAERDRFVDEYQWAFADACRQLSGEATNVEIRYAAVLRHQDESMTQEKLATRFRDLLARETARDMEARVTRHGPHRDDLLLSLEGRPVGVFGSEGQCRLMSLALRLASVDVLTRGRAGRPVVLLIDDVLGELDASRRRNFLACFDAADQVLLACTEAPPELAGRTQTVLRVSAGSVAAD